TSFPRHEHMHPCLAGYANGDDRILESMGYASLLARDENVAQFCGLVCGCQEILLRYGAIGNLKTFVDNRKSLTQLLFVNTKRRICIERIPPHDGIEALLAEELSKRSHLFRCAVEWGHRLLRLAITNEFEDAKQSNGADCAHGGMFLLQVGTQLFHHCAHLSCVVDQMVLFIHSDGCKRGRASHRVRVVGKASVKNFVVEVLRDVVTHTDRAQG